MCGNLPTGSGQSNPSAPTALASALAHANLLIMLADVRGYLALGDEEYRI